MPFQRKPLPILSIHTRRKSLYAALALTGCLTVGSVLAGDKGPRAHAKVLGDAG
jgi:hypothetical protein